MEYLTFKKAFWLSALFTTLPATILLIIADQGKTGNFVDDITNHPLIFLGIAGAWTWYLAITCCNAFNNR